MNNALPVGKIARLRAIGFVRGRHLLTSQLWLLRAFIGIVTLAGVFSAGVALIDVTGSGVTRTILMIFLIDLPVVIGFQTFSGNSGVVSFGHVAFMAIGAYTAALMSTPVSVKRIELASAPAFIRDAHFGALASMLIAIAVTACIALPLGYIFAALKHPAAASIASLGWLVIAYTVIANWNSVTGGTASYYGIPSYTTVSSALVWCVMVIAAAMLFRRSPIGYGLRATKSSPLVASAIGVNMVRARVVGWVLSAAIAAVGGVLYSGYLVSLSPSDFYFPLTETILIMALVGGPTVSGAVFGTAIISILNQELMRVESATQLYGLSTAILAAIFMLVIIVRPTGLLGRWELDQALAVGARGTLRRVTRVRDS